MDANQMSYEFDVLYDKIASLASPGYTAQEKSIFLTKGQLVYIERYGTDESTEEYRRDFANIIRSTDVTSQATNPVSGLKPNGVAFVLPSDHMYTKAEEVTVNSSNTCLDASRMIVLPKMNDEYGLQIHNPHKRPELTGSSFDSTWSMTLNDDTSVPEKLVQLITDSTYTVNTYHLTYMKEPVDIVPVLTGDTSTTVQIDCELNDTAHREIVEIAIRIASGITNPQEYQIKLNEEKINN